MSICFRREDPQALQALFEKNRSFSGKDFDPDDKGIPGMEPYPVPAPVTPRAGIHPRLLLTRQMLPAVRSAMEDGESEAALAEFLRMIDTQADGVLPPAALNDYGVCNFDNSMLAVFQSKALAYLLSGNREYGIEAVIGIKNYIRTFEIQWLRFDQCRHYGYTMFIAACVYDWCYDLLSDEDRAEIVSGIGYLICTGESVGPSDPSLTTKRYFAKMEMGFPPKYQGAVTGHGCEMQLMRDYLSFAVAIFDEVPSWWNFVGARYYAEYIDIRNVYFHTGLYPQGTTYTGLRFIADSYAAWILKFAVGAHPFRDEDMRQVIGSMLAFETENDGIMAMGDYTYTKNGKIPSNYGHIALIGSFLFSDAAMKAQAKHLGSGYTRFSYAPANITPSEFFILHSNLLKPADDRYCDAKLLHHNGGFIGQTIARDRFGEGCAVALMKGAGRTTMNHDHADAGTFQIYYKGLYSGDAGIYETYGTDHHLFYHQATVAHNGILVYAPALRDPEIVLNGDGRSVNRSRFWYTGGQKRGGEVSTFHEWLSPFYDTGRLLGHAEVSDGKTPRYAYLAADYTAAYDKGAVRFIGRQMLTVFPDDTEVPMLLFIGDKIVPEDADERRVFLFQCPKEPKLDESSLSLTVEDGGGCAVLTNLIGGDTLRAYGGEGQTFFVTRSGAPEDGVNIASKQNVPGEVWGHAEIDGKRGTAESELVSTVFVTDAGKFPTVVQNAVRGENLDGAVVTLPSGKTLAVIFSRDETKTARRFTLPLHGFSGEAECFVLGVGAGTYALVKDGHQITLCDADATGAHLHFTVREGDYSLVSV